ncbi:MAG TPA: ketopantoate reductase family protein [Candidatus Limiplasma sp.]|nr:ketopantoate reductase family protein [Candidatus Limiplasma sp.]HRX08781.1 ketopantoate reductase family protein [Candidatus Limiplasma sp.]
MSDSRKHDPAEIQTVTIVGLGALGTLFGNILAKSMPKADLRILADPARIARYKQDGVFANGIACDFQYVSTDDIDSKADLILVAVKAPQLPAALETMAGHVGDDTLILSLLNGISSEAEIGSRYGMERVVDCVAYGMDAVKEGNRLTYGHTGRLCIGTRISGEPTKAVRRIERFFKRTHLPYEISESMGKRMWGKFMLNVGVNQAVAVFGPDYGSIQQDGEAREVMIAAMWEVIQLSRYERVNLTEDDLRYWLNVLSGLSALGKPSMRQDVEAKRPSEVALFSGTVLALARKHGLDTPVNHMLYQRIQEIEAQY